MRNDIFKSCLKTLAVTTFLFSSYANAAETKSEVVQIKDESPKFNIVFGGGKTFAIRENDGIFSDDNTKLNGGYDIQAGINYATCCNIEVGIEGGYRTNNQINKKPFNNGMLGAITFQKLTMDSKTLTLLAKGNYHFNINDKFVPYVGVGLGFAKTDISVDGTGTRADGSEFVNHVHNDAVKAIKLAYSADLGVMTHVTENTMVGAGIQYFGTMPIERSDFKDKDLGQMTIADKKIDIGELSGKVFVKLFV
jgi:opacity protein-like surface antigen